MTVIEYCREKTEVNELVIIRSSGFEIHCGTGPLFRLPPDIARAEVTDAHRGSIVVAWPANTPCYAPCVYLDIK